MASLNTLRTKGGVFLTAVIVIALLAFILGDASSCTGNQNPEVGEINGVKVKYTDFYNERQRQEEVFRMQYGRNAGSDQSEVINNAAWDNMVMAYAYRPGFEKMGLGISEAEQVDMATGMYLSPVLQQTFVNQNTGMFDPALMASFVEATGYDSGAYIMWDFLKEQMGNERMVAKYMSLLSEGFYVTDLEVNQAVGGENKVFNARVLTLPYSDVADSTIHIAESDARKYYNENKELFRQAASRDIEYVVFDIMPVTADFEAASVRAQELATGLASAVNPLQYAQLNSPDGRSQVVYMPVAGMQPEIARLVEDPSDVYGPVLEGETYTISRLGDVKMMPDSIRFSHIVLGATDTALADSLMGVVNRGGNFAQLAREYSVNQYTAPGGGDSGSVDPSVMPDEVSPLIDAVIDSRVGQIVKVTMPGEIHIVRVDAKSAPVRKAKIATLKYTVKAGSATTANVLTQAREFYNAASGSFENFKKASAESAFPKRVARIRNTDRDVSGLDRSIELVRWAFNNKAGSVSEPMELNSEMFDVAAVKEVREAGIAPYDQALTYIQPILERKAKAKQLIARVNGGTIDQAAASVSKEVVDAEGVKWASFYIDGVGMEPALVGAIASATQTGGLSKPVEGMNGVYYYEVTGIEDAEAANATDTRLRLETMTGNYMRQVNDVLYRASNVKDERVKFF